MLIMTENINSYLDVRDSELIGFCLYFSSNDFFFFFFSSRRRHTRFDCDWSSDVCSSDLPVGLEYQDTNRLQAEILHALKPDGAGVAVVGDDAQAIYSFRAAAVENILGFPDRFSPRAEVITLAQNYRSTQAVLDVANAVMAEAPRQYRKHLLSIRGQGARPRLVTVDELQSQAEYICNEILRRREANVPLTRQAVLFRSASHSDILEVELARRKIPFVKFGGLKFLEAGHIKDLI